MIKKVLFTTITAGIILSSPSIAQHNFDNQARKTISNVGISPAIKLEKPSPFKQGGSVIVKVTSEEELINPKISFAGKISKLFKVSSNQYRGITGVNATQKPGGYTLKAVDDSGKLNFAEVIEVYPGYFPTQNIRISGKKAGLQATKDELEKVAAAKEILTSKSFWSNYPMAIPTTGCVISTYGRNRLHNGKDTGDYHKGIDIKAPLGNSIKSMAGGKVLIAEDFRLHGKTVAIDHGQGLMSIYIHMNQINVKKGDILSENQKIGTVGSTGFATGPHLHWGVYVNGSDVNPLNWVPAIRNCY